MEYLYIVLLVVASGLFSGMNLGFFSLSIHDLERKERLGNKAATKILSVRRDGNWLLTTLLLGNVIVNTILSVFLGSITTGLLAVIIATSLIVLFGEIVPQAAFARFAIRLTPPLVPVVRILMFALAPIAWPIAKLLDSVLGEEMTPAWSRRELRDIVEQQEGDEIHAHTIDPDERQFMLGALTYSHKTAGEVMTPRDVVYSLSIDRIIDSALFDEMHQRGFTRIPIYENDESNIVAVLNVKDTMIHDDGVRIRDLCRRNKFLVVPHDTKLDILLSHFVKQKVHIGCVFKADEFVGIITLEDVIEEILDLDIVDEQDQYADMRKLAEARTGSLFS